MPAPNALLASAPELGQVLVDDSPLPSRAGVFLNPQIPKQQAFHLDTIDWAPEVFRHFGDDVDQLRPLAFGERHGRDQL